MKVKDIVNIMIGRIYEITNEDKTIRYIGSTKESIIRRWQMHKKDFKRWREGKSNKCEIYSYFEEYGVGYFEIRLISEHNIETNVQLRQLEQAEIDKHECVNSKAAFRSADDVNSIGKRIINCSCGVSYTFANESRHKQSTHHQNSFLSSEEQEKIKQDKTKEREERAVAKRQRTKVLSECKCGGKFQIYTRQRHLRSDMHKKWLNNQ